MLPNKPFNIESFSKFIIIYALKFIIKPQCFFAANKEEATTILKATKLKNFHFFSPGNLCSCSFPALIPDSLESLSQMEQDF